jgi:hypothetical protein
MSLSPRLQVADSWMCLMKVGDLVCSRHDTTYRGIVMKIGPKETKIDHSKSVAKVQWFDGDITFEFKKMLVVLSETDT